MMNFVHLMNVMWEFDVFRELDGFGEFHEHDGLS